MATPIRIKRSAVSGKKPQNTDLQVGELALNTYDGSLFTKRDTGGVGIATTVSNITPWVENFGGTSINYSSGDVGIGSDNPTSKLDINGSLNVSAGATFAGNITANGNIVGDDSTNISGISSVTATSLYGALTGNVQGNLTGTVLTDAQPNITSLGTLGSLNVTNKITANDFESTVSTGTAPFVVASTTKVTNLNADLLDGKSTANSNVGNSIVVRNAAGGFLAGDVTFGNIVGTALSISGNIVASGVITARDHIKFANSGDGIIFGTEENSDRPSIIGNYVSESDNHIVFNTTGTEKVRIDKDGQVGIGTTDPDSLLTLDHATNPAIQFRDSGTKVASINAEGTQTNIASFESKDLVFAASTSSAFTERMRIKDDGKVGIGTDDPTVQLQVYRKTQFGGNPLIQARSNNGSTNELKFEIDGDGDAYFNGKVGIGTLVPSHELTLFGDDPIIEILEKSVSSKVTLGTGTVQGFINIQKANGTRTVQISSDGNSYFKGGRVGIGTNDPSAIFDVTDGTTRISFNRTNNTPRIDFKANNVVDLCQIKASESLGGGVLQVFTKTTGGTSTERVRILSDGKVKICHVNGENPTEPLHVVATAVNQDIARFTGANRDRGLVISTGVSGITNDAVIKYNADSQNNAGQHVFLTDGIERLRIDPSGNLKVTGIATFDQNVSIGGTLTYEDVTNIDSVGIVTAQTGIKVLAGGINAVGVVTGTSFESTVSTGTAPFVVASQTRVDNLNADLLDGRDTSNTGGNDVVMVTNASGNSSLGSGTFTAGTLKVGTAITAHAGVITATSFSGSGASLTGLTGASANTYGSSTLSPVITVDANGRITTISTASISGGGGGEGSVAGINTTGTSIFNILDIGGDIDVDGHTELDNLNVSGISTFAGITTVTGHTLFTNKISNSGIITSNVIHLTGGSFTASHASGETKSDTAIVVNENFGIYSLEITGGGNDSRFLRSIIQKDSDVISIGQDDTNLIGAVNIIPGNHGTVSIGHSGAVSLVGVSQDGTTANIEKLRTVGSGITVFGNTETQTLNVSGVSTLGGKVRIDNTDLTTSSSADELIIGDTSGNRGLTIFSGTSNTGNIFFADTSTTGVGNRMGTITYDHSDNYMRFSTSGNQEKLRITSNGKIGIGTTNPSGKLHISSGISGDCELIIEADADNSNENDNPRILFRQDGGQDQSAVGTENNELVLSNSVSGGGIVFKTGTSVGYDNATEKVRITSDGKVGIGTDLTTTPSSTLTVAPHNSTSGRNISIYTSGAVGNKAGIFFNSTSGTGNLAEIQAEYKGTNQGELVLSTSMQKRLTINKDGEVGIGTDNPTANLQVNDASNESTISLYNAGTKKISLQASNNFGSILYSYDGEPLIFSVHSGSSFSEKLRITEDGDVGIGTNNPTHKLEVRGDARITGILTVGESSLTLDGDNNIVNVGTALTLGHTQGVQFHTQNLHASGFEVNQINATGIITANTFKGALTGNVTGTATLASGLTGIPSITVQDITAEMVSIGGTLTYEDVTNIDSIGIITARDNIKLTAAEGQIEATGSTGLTLNASDGSAFARIRVAGDTRLHITSDGNVGIGTATAPHLLSVKGTISKISSTSGIQLVNIANDASQNGTIAINQSGGTERIKLHSSGASYFNGGNVGIGSVVPSQKLDVAGNIKATGQVRVSDGTTAEPSVAAASDTNSGLYFPGADAVGLVAGGSRKLLANSSGITINNGDLSVNGGNLDVTGDIRHIDNTNTKIAFTSNQISFDTAGTERLRIASDGNIGIGTDNPTEDLHITAATPVIRLEDSDTSRQSQIVGIDGNLRFDADNNNAQANTNISFRTDGTEALRIDSDGKLLIGITASTSNDANLQVFKSSGNNSTIAFGNVATSASGLSRVDFCPSNSTVGARIECHATEDFASVANRTADLVFVTRKNGTHSEKLRIDSGGRLFTGGSTQVLDSNAGALHISCGTSGGRLAFRGTTTSAEASLAEIFGFWDTNKVAGMIVKSGTDTTNKDDGSLHFYTRPDTATGTVERLSIDSSGKVGINSTAPTAKLDIVEATSTTAVKIKSGTNTNQNTHITMFNDNDVPLHLGVYGSSANTSGTIASNTAFMSSNSSGGLAINAYHASGVLKFGTGSSQTERLRIDSTGDLTLQGGKIYGEDNASNSLHLQSTSGNNNHSRIEIGTSHESDNGGIHFYTAGSSVATQRMVIKGTSGNVGIGTDNPTNKFEVFGTDAAVTLLNYGQSSGGLAAWPSGRLAFVSAHQNDDLVFGYSNSTLQVDNFVEAMRIDNGTGKVGIGTINPDELLHLFSASSDSKIVLEAGNNSAVNGIFWNDENSNTQSEFYYSHPDNKQFLKLNGNGLEIYSNQTSSTIAKVGHGIGYNEVVIPNGKVGVGTDDPKTELDVRGSISMLDSLVAPHGGTVTYAVTVAAKVNHRYPAGGGSSSNAYYIDGIESPVLTLTPGRTYRFTHDNTGSHPLKFYHEAAKTTLYTSGVDFQNTYTEITVTETTPSVLYYQCTAHGYMGNAVITNSEGLYHVGVSTFTSVINANNGINLTSSDNKSILLGEHEDMRIRHTGSHSEITDEGTGSLRLGGDQVVIGNAAFDETNAVIKQGAAGYVTLKQNGTTRLQTTSTGVVVTGILTATSFKDANGNTIGGGGGGVTVQDEGSALSTTGTTLNFVGNGVVASGTGATKTITISGGGSGVTVQDEGSDLSTSGTTLNFVGDGVVASGTGATKTITISGGGGGTGGKFVENATGIHTLGNVGLGTTNASEAILNINTGTGVTDTVALDVQGSEGSLFSVTNNLTSGSLFSINDVSGIPAFDYNSNGNISMGAFADTVAIGKTSSGVKLGVKGSITEGVHIVANKVSAASTINVDNGNVHYFSTSETTTATPNITSTVGLNTSLDTGDTLTVAIIYKPSGAGYYAHLTIDGVGQNEQWLGGSAPSSAGASGYDVNTYNIIKTGDAAYIVLANNVNFA